jgi:hypothetical protein
MFVIEVIYENLTIEDMLEAMFSVRPAAAAASLCNIIAARDVLYAVRPEVI